jgi:hypothetical protein
MDIVYLIVDQELRITAGAVCLKPNLARQVFFANGLLAGLPWPCAAL